VTGEQRRHGDAGRAGGLGGREQPDPTPWPQTQDADCRRTASVRTLTRPATDAEQTLLSSLGLGPAVEVDVERVTGGGAVVRRVYREGAA
jgi:hypothetical protein